MKQTHSLLIIGYGTYKGKDYWLLKNRYNFMTSTHQSRAGPGDFTKGLTLES